MPQRRPLPQRRRWVQHPIGPEGEIGSCGLPPDPVSGPRCSEADPEVVSGDSDRSSSSPDAGQNFLACIRIGAEPTAPTSTCQPTRHGQNPPRSSQPILRAGKPRRAAFLRPDGPAGPATKVSCWRGRIANPRRGPLGGGRGLGRRRCRDVLCPGQRGPPPRADPPGGTQPGICGGCRADRRQCHRSRTAGGQRPRRRPGFPARVASGIAPEQGLQVHTIWVARAISMMFLEIKTIYGYRQDPLKWHPNGLAIDVMIPNYHSQEGIDLGNQIAGYALANAKRWGVLHVIWRPGASTRASARRAGRRTTATKPPTTSTMSTSPPMAAGIPRAGDLLPRVHAVSAAQLIAGEFHLCIERSRTAVCVSRPGSWRSSTALSVLTACGGAPGASRAGTRRRGARGRRSACAPGRAETAADPERDLVKTASMTVTVANPGEAAAADKAAVAADGRKGPARQPHATTPDRAPRGPARRWSCGSPPPISTR